MTNTRNLTFLLLAIFALKVVFLVGLHATGINLSPDEAYYWDWSRHLDLGYYSKPPGIAWLMAASDALWGRSETGLRLPAVLFSTGLIAAGYLTTRVLYGARTAFWIALLLLLTPASLALGVVMTVDSPTLFFWTLAILFATLGIDRGNQTNEASSDHQGWWWLAGSAAALGLLFKQTMVAFPMGITLYLFIADTTQPTTRVHRALAVALPMAVAALPMLWWNQHHGWITMQHTSEHFHHHQFDFLKTLQQTGEFLGLEFALFTPVTFALVLWTTAWGGRRFLRLDPGSKLLFILGPLPLLCVFLLSLTQRVQPNWPAPFVLTAILFLGAWVAHKYTNANNGAADDQKQANNRIPTNEQSSNGTNNNVQTAGAIKSAVIVGGAFFLITLAFPFALYLFEQEGSKVDALKRLREWRELAQQVHTYRTNSSQEFLIAATHRQPVSLLAFYLPDAPRVYRYHEGPVDSQHELWPGPNKHLGQNALIIADMPPDKLPEGLRKNFREIAELGELIVPIGKKRRHRYYLYRGQDLLEWSP